MEGKTVKVTEGVCLLITVMANEPEVLGLSIAQLALDVTVQVTISPLFKGVVAWYTYAGALVLRLPARTPFNFHRY
jgi:hypothetical protein